MKNKKVVDGQEIIDALTKEAKKEVKNKSIKIQSGIIIDGSIHSVSSFPDSKIKRIIKNTHWKIREPDYIHGPANEYDLIMQRIRSIDAKI